MNSAITRPVVLLGMVSLFTDLASEMLYPVLPIFLTTVVGASMLQVGLIEGLAESAASLLKGFFGAWSDRMGRRKPFIVGGYTLSAFSKPLPGLWSVLGVVVFARLADRVGKALRAAPRDALLAALAPAGAKGAVFGFHRAMDTLGAALGPALAVGYLWLFPGDYRALFLIAFLPGAAASLLTTCVKDQAPAAPNLASSAAPVRLWEVWTGQPHEFRRLTAAAGVFALVNSSDVFLIMKARQVGFSDTGAIGGYILYNLVYALAAYPCGRLSDRWGKRNTLMAGLTVYALVYLGFAAAWNMAQVWVLFALYALYAASSESIFKAWTAEITAPSVRGSAFGILNAVAGVGALAASVLAGWLWEKVDPAAPFILAAAGAAAGMVLLPAYQNIGKGRAA